MKTFKSLIQNLTEGEKRFFRLTNKLNKIKDTALAKASALEREGKILLSSVRRGRISQQDALASLDTLKNNMLAIRRQARARTHPGSGLAQASKRARDKYLRRAGFSDNPNDSGVTPRTAFYTANTVVQQQPGGARERGIQRTKEKRFNRLAQLQDQLELAGKYGKPEEVKRIQGLLKQATNQAVATSRHLQKHYPTR